MACQLIQQIKICQQDYSYKGYAENKAIGIKKTCAPKTFTRFNASINHMTAK